MQLALFSGLLFAQSGSRTVFSTTAKMLGLNRIFKNNITTGY